MLPTVPGLVSVHDLKTVFSDSTEWITIHQLPESIEEPEYLDKGPWMQLSFQLVPGQPVDTDIELCHQTGLVKRVKLRRRPTTILQPGR